MKKIDSKELKELQYNLLLYIKEVCEKYDIKYFIGYGTLLGAVRHKGFIPWDDDIDVILLRQDYERFVEVMKGETHEYYRFCDIKNGERCHGPYGIMEDTRTAVTHERFDAVLLKDEGVSVDIFPLDDLPDNENAIKKIIKYQKLWKAFNNLRVSVKFPESDNLMRKAVKAVGKIAAHIIGKRRIYHNIRKVSKKKFDSECHMVGDLMCDPDVRTCFPKEIFEETTELLFEKDYFKAPKYYERFLERCYGDYMQFPPEEERRALHEYEYFWR